MLDNIVVSLWRLHLPGVAFSKHIVQLYTYNPTGEMRQHLEVKLVPLKNIFFLGSSMILVIDLVSHLLD